MTGIYAIVHALSGRRYIGRSANIAARWKSHKETLRRGCHHNHALQIEWARDGEMGFQFTVLELCDSVGQCQQREQEYLRESVGLYNASSIVGSGPKPGYRHRPESIEKMRAAQRGKPKSPEHRAHLSAARKGVSNPKLAAALRGRKASIETRQRMSAAHKARHVRLQSTVPFGIGDNS